jgi:hypothetical protein
LSYARAPGQARVALAIVPRCPLPSAPQVDGVWRSLVAHSLWERGAVGSNPATPTITRLLEPVRSGGVNSVVAIAVDDADDHECAAWCWVTDKPVRLITICHPAKSYGSEKKLTD